MRRVLGLIAGMVLATFAARAEGPAAAGVAWSGSGADGERLVLQLPPSADLEVMVRPFGVELFVPGGKAPAGALPADVVLARDPGGMRLRVERPGASLRGVRRAAGQVEVLLAGVAAARGGPYRIGVGDVIALSVYKNPDLSGDLTVGPDGSVTLPLVGAVRAAGRTDTELAEEIRSVLAKDYLVDPQISVGVKAYQSQFVYVAGAVPRAARVPLKPNMTLKDVLSEAGVALAPGQEVVRTRQGAPPAHLTAGQLEAGAEVPVDGDVLTVQERDYVVVNGEVRRPGRQVLTPGMTLLEAIAVVEGLTDWASKKDVRILRREEATGAQRELVFNLRDVEGGRTPDPALQSGDVVLVGRRFL